MMTRAGLAVIVPYVVTVMANMAGVRIVTTASVPMGVYLTRPLPESRMLQQGDLVCVRALSDYAPAALREAVQTNRLPTTWIKVVAGVAGDEVTRPCISSLLVVNGEALAQSQHHAVDSRGYALPVPPLPTQLDADHVWLSSRHDNGYDSRYFGAVDVRALSCIARPLWTL